MLTRTTPVMLTPEVRLIISVLVQAWSDAEGKASSTGKAGAVKFFVDGRAGLYAETIGIDPDFIKEIFLKHHPKAFKAAEYV
jgi:hypothetical protein